MERSGSLRRIIGMGNNNSQGDDERLTHSESADEISRKRSMIKPERQRLTPDNPQYFYTLASEESNINVHPSSTGNDPHLITSNSAQQIHLEGTAEDELGEVGEYEGPGRIGSNASKGSFRNKILQKAVSSPLGRSISKSSGYNQIDNNLGRSNSGRSTTLPFTNFNNPSVNGIDAAHDNIRRDQSFHSTNDRQYVSAEPAEHVIDPQAADTAPDITVESQLQPSYSFEDEKRPYPKPIMPNESKFDPWQVYCKIVTFPIVTPILRWFGLNTPERQMAWREKIGLITCILYCGAAVGFLTFGFTETVCSSTKLRIPATEIQSDYLVISGQVYDMGQYSHPAVEGIQENSPIMYPPVNAGGTDASFLFQNVNGNCLNIITPRSNSTIPHNDKNMMGWYFPCQLLGYSNNTLIDNDQLVTKGAELYNGWGCHTYQNAREALFKRKPTATLYFTWDQLLQDANKHLVTYNGDILDLSRLDHILHDDLEYPQLFDTLRNDATLMGRDISQDMSYGKNRKVMNCLREITKVGEVDSEPIGCIASKVVLYVSLVFIMGLVVVKFLVACYFRFFIARRQGAFPISETEFHNRERNIENWGDDIYSPAHQYRALVNEGQYAQQLMPEFSDSANGLPSTPQTKSSVFSSYAPVGAQANHMHSSSTHLDRPRPGMTPSVTGSSSGANGSGKRRSVFLERLMNNPHDSQHVSGVTMSTQNPVLSASKVNSGQSLHHQPLYRQSIYSRQDTGSEQNSFDTQSQLFSQDLAYRGMEPEFISMDNLAPPGSTISRSQTPYTIGSDSGASSSILPVGPLGGSSDYTVPQPPVEYQPFGYPLAHIMCMVTAYSESVEGLRTTLDSICTTDYPNSHKLIMIVCDGLIKGSGNDLTTPEICLSMMKDFSEPIEDQQAHSYVSVVSGEKRHNMAKVYAGFYSYDDSTVPPEKQQRVPVICVVKCGTPKEANSAKPGNRGKRDSQVILMSFLQHVMFDERMTELDFQLFNGIRSITGIAPDYYEMMLMVDADTKVFPDCLTHMVAEMVRDPEVMGLCGETKIANKRQSWVTMIQVFEYFISHHQAKGFESVFGSVSCLPGCFSMYRIKSPKGADGYWVPILCNPDIVERYSDNVIDTLHRKNLLLLGEDRYLSTLMAKTFPKRKTIFVPKAACKTVVPDEFKVLLSQRRRWINSTIHNLFELVLVRNSCGVFVISMQFVVFIDLVSTLVLPAAIAFTLYVVIIAIIRKPTPILSLVLLAMILGLPGFLIVVTATRASYVVWMLIYILALPIWNFVLPMYAYWKFDDFSWGNTRAIAGGDKGHEEADGEFDSSQIVMKRWKEFQLDRAKESGTLPGSTVNLNYPYQN